MRIVLSSVLAALLVFSFAACNSDSGSQASSPQGNPPQKTETPQERDERIWKEAQKLLEEGRWTEAIAKIRELPEESFKVERFQELLASAYSGRCGLNLIEMVEALDNVSTSSLFAVLVSQMREKPNWNDCKEAEAILLALGEANQRTEEQNLLLALTSLAKIGSILSGEADLNNDGVADIGYNACLLPDSYSAEMVVSFSLSAQALAEISSLGDAVRNAMNAVCAVGPTFCENDVVEKVSALERDFIKTLTNQGGPIGLGTSPGTTCP